MPKIPKKEAQAGRAKAKRDIEARAQGRAPSPRASRPPQPPLVSAEERAAIEAEVDAYAMTLPKNVRFDRDTEVARRVLAAHFEKTYEPVPMQPNLTASLEKLLASPPLNRYNWQEIVENQEVGEGENDEDDEDE
ncbi:hypothetical protein H9P43_004404 [Blastocladiella emersonii ATCC 22665]|nr:hypothetical protein H9P43_004404 [Blastocladiella emersonii ATCC 22665]